MPTRVWVTKGPEWAATAAALRLVENRLPHWLKDELEDTTDSLVDRARAAAERVDIRGGPAGHTGLRSRVAAGVGSRSGLTNASNPYIRIYTSMADPSESPIPMGMDQERGWRHPLYGDKRHWFQSTPVHPGWFSDTIADGRDEIERALEDALQHAASVIDAAS